MRSCPNCGGGLKFDIASQGLLCGNCSSKFAIGEVPEARAAKADGTMDAMIFSCPQCGGEVWSTSETAAGFCSFCGASVQLAGRMAAERMPEKIVPFKITKEECAKKFHDHVKGYFFSPGDLRQENAKLEFRGIYMPYWDYSVHQEGLINRRYEEEHRDGDYIVTSHYDFTWDLNEDINDIQHDASTSFDDEVGLAIAPFEPKDSVPFDSGYMEGFYGDVSDTDWDEYADFAIDTAVDHTEQIIDSKTIGIRTDNGPTGNEEFHGRITKYNLSMFPVWFMSYRSGNRIAYSAVNGQTGKVHVDLPVSLSKFFGLTTALTVALFALLMLFLTPTPQMDVVFSTIMTIASSFIFATMSKKILEKDGYIEDTANGSEKPGITGWFKGKSLTGIIGVVVWIVIAVYAFIDDSMLAFLPVIFAGGAIASALWACSCFASRSSQLAKAKGGGVFPSPMLALASSILAMAVLILNPPSDSLYYGITLLAMMASALSLVSMLSLRNLLCTRRMPEFDTHKGGDHRAK